MLEFLRSRKVADKVIAWKKSRAEQGYNKAFARAQEVDRRREKIKEINEMRAETARLNARGSAAGQMKARLREKMPMIKERLGKIATGLGSGGANIMRGQQNAPVAGLSRRQRRKMRRVQQQSRPRISSNFLLGPRNPGSPGGTGGTGGTSWHY